MQIDDPHAIQFSEHSIHPSRGRIAVVDDDEGRRRTLRDGLVARGFTAFDRPAGDGLPHDVDLRCDAVFVGQCALQPSPGYVRRVVEALPDVPVLVVTGEACERDAVIDWMRAGAHDVVVAPRGPDDLIDAIERVTQRSQRAVAGAGVTAECFCQASRGVLPFVELERRALQHALQCSGDSVSKAARTLGIGRTTMYRKISELDLVRPTR